MVLDDLKGALLYQRLKDKYENVTKIWSLL